MNGGALELHPTQVDIWFLPRRDDLNAMLAVYLRCAPAAVVLERDLHGKPFLPGRPLQFNLSHAANMTMLAIASFAVGIDIEIVERPAEQLAGMMRYFHPAERAALASMPVPARQQAIAQTWTRKESFVKALGIGLSRELQTFRVFDADPAIATLIGAETAGWQVIDLDVPSGYAASVAMPIGAGVRRMGVWNGPADEKTVAG